MGSLPLLFNLLGLTTPFPSLRKYHFKRYRYFFCLKVYLRECEIHCHVKVHGRCSMVELGKETGGPGQTDWAGFFLFHNWNHTSCFFISFLLNQIFQLYPNHRLLCLQQAAQHHHSLNGYQEFKCLNSYSLKCSYLMPTGVFTFYCLSPKLRILSFANCCKVAQSKLTVLISRRSLLLQHWQIGGGKDFCCMPCCWASYAGGRSPVTTYPFPGRGCSGCSEHMLCWMNLPDQCSQRDQLWTSLGSNTGICETGRCRRGRWDLSWFLCLFQEYVICAIFTDVTSQSAWC